MRPPHGVTAREDGGRLPSFRFLPVFRPLSSTRVTTLPALCRQSWDCQPQSVCLQTPSLFQLTGFPAEDPKDPCGFVFLGEGEEAAVASLWGPHSVAPRYQGFQSGIFTAGEGPKWSFPVSEHVQPSVFILYESTVDFAKINLIITKGSSCSREKENFRP